MREKYEKCSKCGGENTGSHICYCKECYNAWKRERYKKHREKEINRVVEYNRKNYEDFKKKLSEYRKKPEWKEARKEWESKNKDKVYIYSANKNSKRRASISNSEGIKTKDWESKKAMFNYKCAYCGVSSKKLQMDHVVPLSKGGSHSIDNVVPCCADCNNKKNAKDEFDFRRSLGQLL